MEETREKRLIRHYRESERQLRKYLEETHAARLDAKDRTFDLIEIMAASITHVQTKAMNVKRRFREATETREAFCFISFLYFDIRSQELSDRFKVTRQVVHHYCMNVIAKYQIYSDFRENILEFFSKEEMDEMIKKFNDQKRNGKKTESKNKKYGKTVRQLQ